MEHLIEGLQNYMENKSEGNEKKIILPAFNCNADKKNKDGGNKTQGIRMHMVPIMHCQNSP